MRHLITLAAASATLAVASCSNPTETANAAESGAPGQVGAELKLEDLPSLRAGVWRNTITDSEGDTNVIRQCIGENEPLELMGSSECMPKLRRIANGISISGQCKRDDIDVEVAGRIMGDFFQTRGTMDIRLKVTKAGEQLIDERMQAESVYEGPCAEGQEPGLIQDGE